VERAIPVAANEVAPFESESVPAETLAKSITAAKPLHAATPSIPDGIRNRITGTIPIDVTVHIGKNGAVTRAEATRKPGSLQSYLAQRAVETVRQWKFHPAKVDEKPAPSDAVVHFRFRRSGTEWKGVFDLAYDGR